MYDVLNVFAGVLFIAGFFPYIRAVLTKQAQPVKATWIIWAVLDVIVLAGMYAEGTVNGLIVGATTGACIVLVLSLKYGVPGWSRVDKLCLAGAALGIILWWALENPLIGIISGLVVGTLGCIPTYVSAWKDPSRENRVAWTIYWLSCVLALIAIPNWTLEDAAQPVDFFIVDSIMVLILFYRPRMIAARSDENETPPSAPEE